MLVPQLLPTRPHAAPAPHRKAPAAGGPAHHEGTHHPSAAHDADAKHDAHAVAAHDAKPDHAGATHQGAAHHAAARHGAANESNDSAFDLALLAQQQTFDLTVKQRAENEREMNVLRDMAMAQLKKDDENMKKWIALI